MPRVQAGTERAAALSQAGIKRKQEIAAERRAKVKALIDQGLKGPEIASILDMNIRTFYQDKAIIKRESQCE